MQEDEWTSLNVVVVTGLVRRKLEHIPEAY